MDDRYSESYVTQMFNWLMVLILKAMSFLPFFILFFISDIFYLLVKNVFQYRKKVIKTNLRNSFPDKSNKELEGITRGFYRHFCDIIVESIKIYSIRKRTLEERMQFKSLDLLNGYYSQGKSVVIVGMHFNNWEWCTLLPLKIKHKLLVIYNPLRGNKQFENFLLKYRSRYNPRLVPVHKSTRLIVDFSRSEIPLGIWLLADQSPAPTTKSWMMFLNQETAFFSGPEKIAYRTKQPIVFEHVKKIGRGRYEVYHYPLFEDYEGVSSEDILKAYAKKMEKIISENPEYYLWSHRRWKHKRPGNIPLIKG